MASHDDPSPHAERLSAAAADRLADEIAEVAAHLDAATHALLALIRRFDAGSGWAEPGALSCAHWLSWRIGMNLGAAREHVRVARALGELPLLDDALRRGTVSYSKVRAITRVATPETEASLLEMARSSTASQLERICRGFRRAVAGLGERPEDPGDEAWRRFVVVRETEGGMVRIEAQLRVEEAAAVLKALEVAMARARGRGAGEDVSAERSAVGVSAETSREARPLPERLTRADALVAVAEGYLAVEAEASAAAPAVEIVVHVDDSQLRGERVESDDGDPTQRAAALDDGTAIPLATAERLACDAHVVRVDSAGPGRRTRRISSTLRRALHLRDRGCRFPGCTNRLADAHHIVAWSRGGATRLANLCLLCRRHHRFVHEHGYRIDAAPSGDLAFFRPDGRPLPGAAPGSSLSCASALDCLRAEHGETGIEIDEFTAYPRWDGRKADYDLIVEGLAWRHARRAAERRPAGRPEPTAPCAS